VNLEEARELFNRRVLPTYGRLPVVLSHGEGCYVWDTDGKRYLDCVAGIAVNLLGHAPPRVAKAIAEQATRLIHTSNLYYTESQGELAERLAEVSRMDRFFFCNSGAEANEAAMKFSRKSNRREGFVAARGSFHGRTFATLSLTDSERYQAPFRPLLSGVSFVTYGDVEALKAVVDKKTSALFLEPLQAEGGVNVPPDGYLATARDVCDDAGAMLVFDEVQTGMGRTGEWFAWHRENVQPDLMTLAKGIAGGVPMGALAVAEGIDAFEPGDHASTFGGGPLACAAALATLATIQDEGLVENAQRVGGILLDGFREALDNHGLVEARGRGLLVGAQMEGPGAEVVMECQRQGLLINCTNDTVLRMVPPLILSEEQAKDACKIVGKVATDLAPIGKS